MKTRDIGDKVFYSCCTGWGSNGVTVTWLQKVTAIFSNTNIIGLHFQSKECNRTWGYLMGESSVTQKYQHAVLWKAHLRHT